MMDNWFAVTAGPPPEGVVVDTKVHDEKGCRNEQPLIRKGRLWFFPDMSMYVYYEITHWRYRDEVSQMREADGDPAGHREQRR